MIYIKKFQNIILLIFLKIENVIFIYINKIFINILLKNIV